MYYVYVLKNKADAKLYYGYTGDMDRRVKDHGDKWKLIYFEAYLSENDARKREQKLKHYGQSRAHLKKRVEESLIA